MNGPGEYPSVGSVVVGPADTVMELARLALRRRVYPQSHVDYMVEAILNFAERRESVGGFRIVEQQPVLRHFTARFEPLEEITG